MHNPLATQNSRIQMCVCVCVYVIGKKQRGGNYLVSSGILIIAATNRKEGFTVAYIAFARRNFSINEIMVNKGKFATVPQACRNFKQFFRNHM